MQALAAGQELAGRFRLKRRLGSGGMGEVWLADEMPAERPVALKFPAAGAADRAASEFARVRQLAHPGIVRLHELVRGSPPFLVMQYVDGGDAGALRGAAFRDIVAALVPVAEALEYAHRQGVVHGDLKPANVLRDAAGRLMIVDFALVSPAAGTLPAMSPQQLAGEPLATSDDVYGFGALLYELVAGQPLFHPQVTPERIRGETPAIPVTDLSGAELPESLRRLLAALLQKSPAQRPAGMGAVRAALEEILRDGYGDGDREPGAVRAGVIVPRSRAAPGNNAGVATSRAARSGLPAPVVYGAAAVLLIAALAVIFYLPEIVRERGPVVRVTPPPPAEAGKAGQSVTATAAEPVPQAALDTAMGEFMRQDDELRKLNADKWATADWTELRRLAAAGDAAYRARDAANALARYQDAAALGKKLLARAPEVLAGALAAGRSAIEAGDQAQALAQFETALAVAPDNAEARRGLERARKLSEVLSLTARAQAAESAGARAEALALYRQAVALDPAWTAAVQGVSRIGQAAARDAFETQMARGFAAQAGGDATAARAAFEAALAARPGDAAAQSALAQVVADEKLARLVALQAEAQALEAQERWSDAVARYESLLAQDANLQEARQALERARARADLDARLRREPQNADRFNDDAVLGKARSLLDAARAVENPGPVLRQQVAELEQLLRLAVVPVRVDLQSDNLTEVTVFKVGRLGMFSSKTLELRPGAYTAVGSRPGYRDVRRSFRVGAEGLVAPVVVRCEEPI